VPHWLQHACIPLAKNGYSNQSNVIDQPQLNTPQLLWSELVVELRPCRMMWLMEQCKSLPSRSTLTRVSGAAQCPSCWRAPMTAATPPAAVGC
jgi:hypothetical protein